MPWEEVDAVLQATKAGSEVLFSEDMQSGMTVASLQIQNPFK
jgi:predicted nucleic acid-binding protein